MTDTKKSTWPCSAIPPSWWSRLPLVTTERTEERTSIISTMIWNYLQPPWNPWIEWTILVEILTMHRRSSQHVCSILISCLILSTTFFGCRSTAFKFGNRQHQNYRPVSNGAKPNRRASGTPTVKHYQYRWRASNVLLADRDVGLYRDYGDFISWWISATVEATSDTANLCFGLHFLRE